VFGTGTQQLITPRKPHVNGHHRSHFEPIVTTFDVEGATSTFLRSFGNHQHDQQCLNLKPMIENLYRTSQLATLFKEKCSHKAETEERNYV